MDAGPAVQQSAVDLEPDASDLGPISPELALVDPVLAERARKLLPDPGEPWWSRPQPPTDEPASTAPPQRPRLVPLAPRPRRHRLRTAVLAVLVFAAGAASGGFLRDREAAPSGVVLEAQSAGQAVTEAPPTRPLPKRATADKVRAARSQRTWAANVLGVAAEVAGPGVKLVWQRPPNSGHVVVLRASGSRSTVVFRGRATSYRDASPHPCSAYRYTIVNYDRHGHRSTGVPTSVVTPGCA